MKIIKVNQQPLESLTSNVMVSNVTFAEGDKVIESSQLQNEFPGLQFGGDFLSDRIYVASEEKSPEQILSDLNARNEKVQITAVQESNPAQEIQEKIARLEKEVANFQAEKDKLAQLESSIAEQESKTENIRQSLASSQILIDSRARISEKLGSHKTKLQEISKKTTQEIVNDRKNRISRFMKSVRSNPYAAEKEKKEGMYPPLKWLLIIAIANFIINLIFYVTSFQWIILVIMLASLTFILFNAFIVNIFRPLYTRDIKAIETIVAQRTNTAYDFTEDDHILINNAWVNAFEIELNRIDEVLNQNLQGKNYKDLETELNTVTQNLEALKKQLSDGSAETMSTEEYYKKRRELDILKIELENLGPSNGQNAGRDWNKIRSELPFLIFNLIKNPQIAAMANHYIDVLTQA